MVRIKKLSTNITVIVLGLVAVVAGLAWQSNLANAESAATKVNLSIPSVIALTATPCSDVSDTSGVLSFGTIAPTSTGVQVEVCQTILVDSNAPSYWVNLSSAKSTMDHNPVLTPQATIPSTSAGSLSSPVALANNTSSWGFRIPSGQDYITNTFNKFSASNTYAPIPVSPTPPEDNGAYTFAYRDDQALGLDQYQIEYAVKVTNQIPSGTYQNTVTYTAVAEEAPEPPPILSSPPAEFVSKTSNIVPNFASTITPSGNGTGTNGPQFSIYGGGFGANPTVTIGGQPCTDVVVNSVGNAITCTGPVSGLMDGEQRTFINGVDAGNNYTVWYSSYNFPVLQSLTTSGSCLGTSTTPVIYRDSRDSQLYYVAKLADNKCWMLDNLRYKPNGDTSGTATSGFNSAQVADTGIFLTQSGAGTSAAPNLDSPKYVDPIIETYCYNNTNKSSQNITKCGLLYNFYTATAGTAPQSQTTGNASGSICPVNWRLPVGYDTSGDFGVLDVAYGGTGVYQSGTPSQLATLWRHTGTWRGVSSGFYDSTFMGASASSGYYWSSSVVSAASGYILYFTATGVYPGTANNVRYIGQGVRCVL